MFKTRYQYPAVRMVHHVTSPCTLCYHFLDQGLSLILIRTAKYFDVSSQRTVSDKKYTATYSKSLPGVLILCSEILNSSFVAQLTLLLTTPSSISRFANKLLKKSLIVIKRLPELRKKKKMNSDSTAIGIDLGTTYSCVAVWRNGAVEVIENDQGNRLTPSMVAFTEIECLVGDGAKSQMIQNPMNTVFGIKRIMGQKFHEKSLQDDIKMWSYNVVGKDDRPKIDVMYQKSRNTFSPEEISAKILRNLKEAAEARLEHEVKDAVITVPAYFNDSQRKATIDAGKIAGLNVLHILNEPTAAAIAYGMHKKVGGARNVLVFDLGGGTFDVSIMTIKDGEFTVKAVAGDTHLGGEDFDRKLVEFLIKDFKRKHKKDISNDKKALSKLRMHCEMAKRQLSLEKAISIFIDALYEGIDLQTNITRNRFDDLNMELFAKTIRTVKYTLREAKMEKSDIDDVVLVGGSTRIPMIRSLLQDFFGGRNLSHGINPDEAVAHGAAVLAASLQGNKSEAIQNLHLYDVTPLSLGIEIYRGLAEELIKRNTTIPTKYTKSFATCADNQVAASINVYEGERTMFKDNNVLGSFFLKGLPAEQKGVVTVDVTFDIDRNGTLTVSAVEKSSGIENRMKITNNQGRLTQEEIARMIKEAEKYKADDEQKRSHALNKTNLEECINSIEHDVEEKYMNKITKADKRKILDRCEMITNWLKTDQLHDDREYQKREEELKQMWAPILKKLGGFYNNTSIM